MAKQLPDLAVRAFRAMQARDAVAMGEIITDDFEFHSLFAAIEGGKVFRGLNGVAELLDTLDEAWNGLSFDLESVQEGSAGWLVLYRVSGTARGSGVPLDQAAAMVWSWRGDKLFRSQTFTDLDAARAAAGVQA